MSDRPLRVLLCDDSSGYRMLTRVVLDEDPGFAVVGEAASAQECLKLASPLCPDVILLDGHLPGRSGIEALPEIARSCPEAVIVLLSSAAAVDLEDRALAAGADAFVTKPHQAFTLPGLIRDALAN